MATSLDDFLQNVATQDTRKRLQAYAELVPYLSDPTSSLECDDIDQFISGLAGWVSSSNFKISLNGMELLCLLVNRMGEHFYRHVTTVLPAVIDRLGDAKEAVRDQGQVLLLKLMLPASSPQYIFDRMMGAFTHKLWLVRKEVMVCLQKSLNTYGAKSLKLSQVVTAICKLLEDQNSQVRETAVECLSEIYRHVGEKVRSDISKKGVSQQRLNQVFAKFDELRGSGCMVPTADMTHSRTRSEDDTDFVRPSSTKVLTAKRPSGLAHSTGGTLGRKSTGPNRQGSASSTASAIRRRHSSAGPSAASAGAMDEDLFIQSFEDVPRMQLFSGRDVAEHMTKIREMLDSNADWEKRIDSIKTLRAIVLQGGIEYEEFLPQLRSLEPSFMASVKDLRSQVVREACITVAFLSQQLTNKFDHFAESLLSALINLIPNSAKVMSTSGLTCVKFIIQHTHGARLIPIVIGNLTSKSNVIRRHCIELLSLLLHTWPTHILEKHIAIIQDAIRRTLSDADADARASSRKAFRGFAEHFRDQAESLLQALEPSKKKQLEGELSASSSSNSINSTEIPSRAGHVRSRSRAGSVERGHDMIDRGAPRRCPVVPKAASTKGGSSDVDVDDDREDTHSYAGGHNSFHPHTPTRRMVRSSSASNLGITEGSGGGVSGSSSAYGTAPSSATKSRPLYSSYKHPTTSHLTTGSTHSLPRQKSASKTSLGTTSSTNKNLLVPDRSRGKTKGISQSQPSSRSSSPSSKLNYITHTAGRTEQSTLKTTPRKSGIPRSQGASREGSPSRLTGNIGRERRLSGSKVQPGRTPIHKSAIVAHRVLVPGRDVEQAVADALKGPPTKRPGYESYDSDDVNSDASSICSESSYRSYGQTSEDATEILSNLTSGSYTDRREGLLSLQHLLSSGNHYLNHIEMKKITEVFNRMFHDPHSKVFSVFLETLCVFLRVHRSELDDWLYTLLSRLFLKMGSDLLPSVLNKAHKVMETIRDAFRPNLQFNTLMEFIIDDVQTANWKSKLALLQHLASLTEIMDPADFGHSNETSLLVVRLATWTTEPRSADVRKAAQSAMIGLFNLNTPEFSIILTKLPKIFEERATRVLQNYLRSTSTEHDVLSPRNITSPPGRQRLPLRGNASHNRHDLETENMNPEDIYDSIRKTTADIQNLSNGGGGTKIERYEQKKGEFPSQDSGIQDLRNDSPDADGKRANYNPAQYQDDVWFKGAPPPGILDVDRELFNEALPEDQNEMIAEILTELSNHNERPKERQDAMMSLIKHTREGTFGLWDDHFKSILLILLETLGDTEGDIRALAIRVLREILRYQPDRFRAYAELTILRILEAHKDPVREVVRAAELCAVTLAHSINHQQAIRILNPLIQTQVHPVRMVAIKMINKVIELTSKETLEGLLPETVPVLIKGYNDIESPVRKAAVFCLVDLYQIVGELLRPYILELRSSQMKLLNLYIKRAQAKKDGLKSPISDP